ncbi:Uncharacterised protein [Salmonella enterica subsp. enterica serovar Typhi]|nr:Uncharacterised protein [Salmonella enterica subsp. enterica serovar Typhi]
MFVLHPVTGGYAIIPAAVPGQRVVLPIEAVRLFSVIIFHQLVRIGVLSIAGIEVALATVTGLQLQRLKRSKIPTNHAVDIFVNDPLASGW